MPELWQACLIVCPLVFMAGFVDTNEENEKIISIPAYMLAGLPAHLSLGTNKVVACIGTALASVKYWKNGCVKARIAVWAALGALAGSYAGSHLALLIPEQSLKILILIILPLVAIFLAKQRRFGEESSRRRAMRAGIERLAAVATGLGIGLYDGLAGPGTGTFLILVFTGVFGLDLLTSSGCAKIANLASNVMAAVVYLLNGEVWLWLAAPAMACCLLGNYLGARYAMRGGSASVRKIMFIVLILLFIKCGIDLLQMAL